MADQTQPLPSPYRPASLRIAVAAFLLCSLPCGQAEAQDNNQKDTTTQSDSDYRLGSFDQLRLKIVAWRPSQAEVFEWSAINGEYTVDAGGKISVPLIGEIQAAKTTTGELADLVAKRLQERLNIAQKPDATIEIAKFRPFYIVGDVSNSGEYSYRPGMTVIQAMSIAGGLPRSHAIDVHQIERDVASWTGELNQLTDERTSLLSQIEQQEKLLALMQQDKQQVDSKQKTGLVTEPRYLAAQRDAVAAESELLRLKSKLKETGYKIATDKSLISQSDRIAPTWTGARLSFSVVRPSGTTFVELPATETTLVAPGDTIKVKCCGSEPVDLDSNASARHQSLLLGGQPPSNTGPRKDQPEIANVEPELPADATPATAQQGSLLRSPSASPAMTANNVDRDTVRPRPPPIAVPHIQQDAMTAARPAPPTEDLRHAGSLAGSRGRRAEKRNTSVDKQTEATSKAGAQKRRAEDAPQAGTRVEAKGSSAHATTIGQGTGR